MKLGIPVGSRKNKAELEKILAAFEPELKLIPEPKSFNPVLSSSSSSSSCLSPATKRRASFGKLNVTLSTDAARLLRGWLGRAQEKLRPPELPRLPPAANVKMTRIPQYLRVGGDQSRPTFLDALKDERQNLINTQTVKVQLSKVLPDQAKAKTPLPSTLTVGTPGFGKATPGFGNVGSGVVAGTPFQEVSAIGLVEDPVTEEAATPLPTPRAPQVTPIGDDWLEGATAGRDEAFPSSPEAKSARGCEMSSQLPEGTNFTVGGFEFCAGETVEWGKKRGRVVGISKDAKDVRVRHDETSKLLKIPPDRLVRVELRIGRLFDVFNNSSFD
jgi:hypothetical protein